jgi:HD-GYP domain-containing protein (c-di-GMP phosphodiesterase class II)
MQVFRSVPVDVIQPNERIALDVFVKRDEKLIPFIGQNDMFTEAHFEELRKKGISRLYIRGRDKGLLERYVYSFLDKIVSNPLLPSLVKAGAIYLSSSYAMNKALESPDAESIDEIKKMVKPMIRSIMKNEVILQDLVSITEHDHYTYTHSVNVGILATALTVKFYDRNSKVSSEDLERLSFGYFLHDIGKSRVPLEVLKKAGPLTDEEWEIMKKHPEWGYSILMETGHLTDEAAYISLQHHEQPDGSGYPHGMTLKDIHPCARICAIADNFDALTSERPYRIAMRAYDAVKLMKQTSRFDADAPLITTFIKFLGPQPQALG